MSISDQVILITGGARGIGAETAKALAAKGAKLILTDLDRAALDETAAEIGVERCLALVADVCDLPSMEAAVAAGIDRFGRLDVAVANAGIASYGSVMNTDPAAFKRVLDINVLGVFHTARAALPALVESSGYILVVSSLAAFAAAPGLAAYNASKAGAESLALAVKQEVAFLGIDVGVCHPSWIDTDIVRGAEADLPTFRAIRRKLPYPANSTTTLEECVDEILDGFAKRKARVYVPKGVVLANFTKPLVNSVLMWPFIRRISGQQVQSLEADVDNLGRFQHAHVPLTDPDS